MQSARAETLVAIPNWLPDFQQLRTLVGPTRASYQEVQGLINGTPLDRAEHAARRAAGPDPFDLEPLPDETLMLDGIPSDLHPVVTEISGHLDRLVDAGEFAELGLEFRTACRRFPTLAAANDPAVSRRRAKTLNTTTTVAWVVGRANEVVGTPRSSVTSKDLQSWFGVSGLSSERADKLMAAFRAADAAPSVRIGLVLGNADVLVSRYRERLQEAIDAAQEVEPGELLH